jgi:glycerol uptake facilitator-like aquaporin
VSTPDAPRRKRHLIRLGISELIGTALLVGVGLSVVIVVEGHGSPLAHLVKSPFGLRAITGALFAAVGGSIALSPVGRTSGAHINPIVTLSFFAEGQVPAPAAAVYVRSMRFNETQPLLNSGHQLHGYSHWRQRV